MKRQNKLKELRLEDIVEILGEFDVIHQELPSVEGRLYGLVDYEKRKIYLDSKQDRTEMRDSVLHELYHVKARSTYCVNTEAEVERLTNETLAKLYRKRK
jgi:hypothetical protein